MKRFVFIALIALFVLITAVLIGGPYYAKHYINEKGKELVGRKISLDRLHFNALNGHVLITNFNLFEPDDATPFIQFDTLFVNLTLYKLIGGHVWSDALHLKGLDIDLWKNGNVFSFSDLLPAKDSSTVDTATPKKESYFDKFTVNDIQILYSSVAYEDLEMGLEHNMKDINIKLPGISIGDEKTTAGLEFAFTDGGTFRTNLDYNLIEKQYRWELSIDQLNLNPFTRYVQEALHISNIQGWFSGNILVVGDIDEPATPIISGSMNLNDFALADNSGLEVFGFSSIFIDANEINLGTNNYHFGNLQINRPIINAVLTADGDNVRNLIKHAEAEVDTLIEAEKEFTESKKLTYLLEEFRLNNGEINLEDRTLKSGPFHYSLGEINFAANNLTAGQMVTFNMDALLNKKGELKGHVVTDPGNPGNGTFDFDIKNTPIGDFSPYCEDATGFPITSGRLTFQTQNSIVNNHLNSHLVLNMYNTELGEKRKDLEPPVNVPLKLGLVVLEDTKGRINIDVPAEGDIDDPEFRYGKLVWKVVLNVLVKAAASPYNLLANSLGVDEDQLKFVRMEMLQEELGPEQTTQLDLLAKVLADKPELAITATLNVNTEEEGKEIRRYLAKKGLYLQEKFGNDSALVALTPVDKIKVLELEEDQKLLRFLEEKTGSSPDSLKLDDLIDLYVSAENIENEQSRLTAARVAAFKAYMLQHAEMSKRFHIAGETTTEEGKRRPRFNLSYQAKE